MITTVDIDPHLSGRIAVWTDFRLKDRVKTIPGAKWSPDHKRWTVPLTWGSCLALRDEFAADLVIEPILSEWAFEERALKQELLRLRDMVDYEDTEIGRPTAEGWSGFEGLYPFQEIGARLVELAGQYVFLDETGAGKSRTSLAGLSRLYHEGEVVFPLLVVAPKSMLRTWETEVRRFFPDAYIVVVQGGPAKILPALQTDSDVYILNYDTLRRFSRLAPYPTVKLSDDEKKEKELNAIGFRSVIADECHRLKNPEAKQTRAFWHVAETAKFRLGLTGTPIQDTLEDMWPVLRAMAPHEYPTKSSYVERFLDVKMNRWGGREIEGLNPRHEKEFFANFDTRCRRITKAVALPFLPEKVPELRWVQLPPKARKAYNDMEKKLVAEIEDGTMVADSVLERAGRLVQLANASMTTSTGPDGETVYRMAPPSPKIDEFMDDVMAGDFAGQSVVVFSDSRQLIELLSESMIKHKVDHVMIHGDITGDDRQAAIDRFQADNVQFILITRAGGEGITLTKASVMVRLVRAWSGIVHQQSEDRVHRIGSEIHSSIKIIDYVTEDTVEEGQLVRLTAKGARAQEVLRDKELLDVIRTRMTTEPVGGLFGK